MSRTYEVVAMIITFVATYAHLDFVVSSIPRSFQEVFWQQLTILVKLISSSLRDSTMRLTCKFLLRGFQKLETTHIVNENMYRVLNVADQVRSVVPTFCFVNTTLKVSIKRFVPPGTLSRIGYRSTRSTDPAGS